MSAGEYARLAFRVVVLLQLAYEIQLLEMEQLELQNDRAKTMEKVAASLTRLAKHWLGSDHGMTVMQNYHSALEQLEKLQHERSLRMETPAGELREQVNSLSDTVEHLTSQNKDMEETAAIANQTIQELDEANKKLQYAFVCCMHGKPIIGSLWQHSVGHGAERSSKSRIRPYRITTKRYLCCKSKPRTCEMSYHGCKRYSRLQVLKLTQQSRSKHLFHKWMN